MTYSNFKLNASEQSLSEPLSGPDNVILLDAATNPASHISATSSDGSAFQFSDDSVTSRTLASKFAEVSSCDIAALPHLPRVPITKPLSDIICDVNTCLAHLLCDSMPPLLHCVYLIHAAVATVTAKGTTGKP